MGAQWGNCRYCGQQIIWIRTSGGKNMPCDPTLVDYVEVTGGRERVVRTDGCIVAAEFVSGSSTKDGVGYTSHFATCRKQQVRN